MSNQPSGSQGGIQQAITDTGSGAVSNPTNWAPPVRDAYLATRKGN